MNNTYRGIKWGAMLAILALSIASAGAGNAIPARSSERIINPNAAGLQDSTTAPSQDKLRFPITRFPTKAQRENWRQVILQTPRPKKACFMATYPERQWREIPCKTPPNRPYPPKQGVRPETVGNGVDFSAQAPGHISKSEGSFDSVTGVTSESANGTANAFSLQLNTNFFPTSTCNTSPNPGMCQGWEQYVYSSTGFGGFIQYWMLNYGPSGTTCPGGWNQFSFSAGGNVYCYINSASSTPAPAQTISALGQMKVTGTAGLNGADDGIAVAIGNSVYSAFGDNHFPDLSNQWQESEFNVIGDGNGDQANFNAGSTIVVRTGVDNAAGDPACDLAGFTGETNNLTLVGTAASQPSTSLPSIVFTQSNVPGGTPAACATATSNGDTHLTTFGGLYYDFQASGDFILAQEPGFQVQARQASGAPTWPNASVNKAIAIQMGTTRVAIYIEPTRLIIDGAAQNLADGQVLRLNTGVQLVRHGNVYIVSDDNGNSVHTTLNSSWIDVTVGLGHSPRQTRGLLVNSLQNAQALVTSAGSVLQEPVPFADLYGAYANSWRVNPDESLFTERTTIRFGVPSKPFYAQDLDPKVSARALATCKASGITSPALLESCTLDTTVLNDAKAAKVFTRMLPPRKLIKPVLNLKPMITR